MILALDTSGLELLVALVDADALVAGRNDPGPRHQDHIMELIAAVAGDHLAAVDAVAVAAGPGSHTGLRVGLSTASGIAFSRRLGIHPISSLVIAAHRRADGAGPVLAMVGAGRGRAYIQPFASDGPTRRPTGERRLEILAGFEVGDALAAAEPGVLAQLPGVPPGGDRTGIVALTAAVLEAVGAGKRVNYDQLAGDYGDL